MSIPTDDLYPLFPIGDVGIRLLTPSTKIRKQVQYLMDCVLVSESTRSSLEELSLIITDPGTERLAPVLRSLMSWPSCEEEHVIKQGMLCTNKCYQKHFLLALDTLHTPLPTQILFCIVLMAAWWHALDGSLCLHAASVCHDKWGYLFLGKGGSGKSTLASLSADAGMPVLADDLVFLLRNKGHRYVLAPAPKLPPQITTHPHLRPPLRAVFTLVKDSEDAIFPLTWLETVQALLAGFSQNSTSGYLPPEAVRIAFHTACDVARDVPGFELHFRKSAEFWRVIDEQFG